ncbi:MAG: biopolymer transporter ExbD [Elusimicrobiota bacterium]
MAANPFHRNEEPAPISDVNVVPLADVSLVLLIILLVLSPMAAQSMLKIHTAATQARVALPMRTEILTQREPEKSLAVGVTPRGFVVDGRVLATTLELADWLRAALAGRTERKVFIAPELDASHGRVVNAVETVQNAGAVAALVQMADYEDR